MFLWPRRHPTMIMHQLRPLTASSLTARFLPLSLSPRLDNRLMACEGKVAKSEKNRQEMRALKETDRGRGTSKEEKQHIKTRCSGHSSERRKKYRKGRRRRSRSRRWAQIDHFGLIKRVDPSHSFRAPREEKEEEEETNERVFPSLPADWGLGKIFNQSNTTFPFSSIGLARAAKGTLVKMLTLLTLPEESFTQGKHD